MNGIILNHKPSAEQLAQLGTVSDDGTVATEIDVVYLPDQYQKLFSNIDPKAESVSEVADRIIEWIKEAGITSLWIQGEVGTVLYIVTRVSSFCSCFYATTERIVVEEENGVKTSVFKHVRFRRYEV